MKTIALTTSILLFASCYSQHLVTGKSVIRPPGNAVNFYLFHFMDQVAYTGGDKHINLVADGNVSHFYMPHVNYQVRLGTDIAIGASRKRHGIGFAGDLRRIGPHYIAGGQVSYAFQAVDKTHVQFRVGIMGGVGFTKYDLSHASYGDMIDDRYGFVYPTLEPAYGNPVLVYPRSALGIWLRIHQLGLALNADQLIPVQAAVSTSFFLPPRFSGWAYYQVPVRSLHLMPVISYMYSGNRYRIEGGLCLYQQAGKGVFAGLTGSTDRDIRLMAGYTVKNRLKVLAGISFCFDGMARISPVYSGFGGINVYFPQYGS